MGLLDSRLQTDRIVLRYHTLAHAPELQGWGSGLPVQFLVLHAGIEPDSIRMCDRISCPRGRYGFIGFYASEKRCASSHIVEQCGLFLRRDVGVLICSRYDPVFACNQGGSVFM